MRIVTYLDTRLESVEYQVDRVRVNGKKSVDESVSKKKITSSSDNHRPPHRATRPWRSHHEITFVHAHVAAGTDT